MRGVSITISVVGVLLAVAVMMNIGYWLFFIVPLLLFFLIPFLYVWSLIRLRRLARERHD